MWNKIETQLKTAIKIKDKKENQIYYSVFYRKKWQLIKVWHDKSINKKCYAMSNLHMPNIYYTQNWIVYDFLHS